MKTSVKQKNDQGYTLIEVMAVISLLGLITLLGVPNFRNHWSNYQLSTAAEEVAQNIRLAQKRSISEGIFCKIFFDLEEKTSYRIVLGYKSTKYNLPKEVYFQWNNFSNDTLIFNPSGAPSQGGTVAIAKDGRTLYVIVAVATGRTRVGDNPP